MYDPCSPLNFNSLCQQASADGGGTDKGKGNKQTPPSGDGDPSKPGRAATDDLPDDSESSDPFTFKFGNSTVGDHSDEYVTGSVTCLNIS